MSTSPTHDPRRSATAAVVVGVDGSEASDLAVRWAAETASRHNRRLHIAHGLDLASSAELLGIYNTMVPAVVDRIRRHGSDLVVSARSLAHQIDPSLDVETEVSEANPARLLIRHSSSAYLVALGTSGNRTALGYLGSTLTAVVDHGRGSIVVVRDTGTEQQTRRVGPVVVGLDSTAYSEPAVAAAFAEASERRTQLVAVHAWGDPFFDRFSEVPHRLPNNGVQLAGQAVIGAQLAGWPEKYPDVQVIRKVYPFGPRRALIDWSGSAQLVVVGSRGRDGFRGLLLGSTSKALIQRAHCPVMVVRPK
ncbi:universal stress protein [Nocardia brasiliensis]|uniref:Putative universal stress protein n=1 Tax=Nocardia brasiliensis (strain ATCC 700358 / HUJEG-1) TaxID=1133849 RepID=K0EWW8_NOCB7|nr:universal stress protein [Nocardia brasiliensis]AFU01584.1 putative universal stress protein [Nocardia brasiliensis ATCC 700358]OCF85837.1 universal stress protein [Nocardia brasiliensis]